ncbi:hypothetical protein ACMD2_17274 [Ananas comosus]|uniref:DUF7731 domain-containing protein n=1 Tax=Ananas comosus TaxID=4615 RepID=A0A199VNU4_ANACO|nr:hypothetical protein ACMD2_17274 [Ananas comosus]
MDESSDDCDINLEELLAHSPIIILVGGKVYSRCNDSFRLNEQGSVNIPQEGIDEYCEGPCFEETHLVLTCVGDVHNSFRFSNGASVKDVKSALIRRCGHTPKRGNVAVAEHFDIDNPYGFDGFGDCFDHGNKLTIPIYFSSVKELGEEEFVPGVLETGQAPVDAVGVAHRVRELFRGEG